MKPPEPNGAPITIGEFEVEQRVCECCKDPKPRFFVRKEGELVAMVQSWENLCKERGWA